MIAVVVLVELLEVAVVEIRTAHSLMSCTQPVREDRTCRKSSQSCSETGTFRLALIHVTISVYSNSHNKVGLTDTKQTPL